MDATPVLGGCRVSRSAFSPMRMIMHFRSIARKWYFPIPRNVGHFHARAKTIVSRLLYTEDKSIVTISWLMAHGPIQPYLTPHATLQEDVKSKYSVQN